MAVLSPTLLLDFDGVLVDSAQECLAVTFQTSQSLNVRTPKATADFRARFLKYRYLAGPAEDFLALLKLATEPETLGADIASQFRLYNSEFSAETKAHFLEQFYKIRHESQINNLSEWIALNPFFEGVQQALRVATQNNRVFFVSNKDTQSIEAILQRNDISVPKNHIYGREHGTKKSIIVQNLLNQKRLVAENTLFIDDHLHHLEDVSSVSVRTALACWGYIGPEDENKAKQKGYETLSLASFTTLLMKGAL